MAAPLVLIGVGIAGYPRNAAGNTWAFLNWCLGKNDGPSHEQAVGVLRTIRRRNATIPVFLLGDQVSRNSLTIEVMQLADETVYLLEDTAPLIAGRAVAAIRRYLENLVPPFTRALVRYNEVREYSWAAPGHQGGVAFTKSPVMRVKASRPFMSIRTRGPMMSCTSPPEEKLPPFEAKTTARTSSA